MEKPQISAEEQYRRNKLKAKVLRILAPICFWGLLALAITCIVLAIRYSFGNVAEIMDLLNSKKYNGEQLAENYDFLVKKYGEWVIGMGGKGFITFVNVGAALFSKLMVTNVIGAIIFLLGAFALGKFILPKVAEAIERENQDNVNLTILRSADKQRELEKANKEE